jgi:hypothetical protein
LAKGTPTLTTVSLTKGETQMALHTEDMTLVPDTGELVPVGAYRVRINKVTEGESSTGNPTVTFEAKIQDEGPSFGRPIFIQASLQPHALFTLKAVYSAVGYKPGPEGHDPEQTIDGEMYVYVQHRKYMKDGTEREGHEMPLKGMRSLSAGPWTPRG